MNKLLLLMIGVALVCLFSTTTRIAPAGAQTRTVTVQVDKPGATVSGKQIGIFFEDINFGADGGIYAELVKNRSFEFPQAMMGWTRLEQGSTGSLNVMERESAGGNDHYLRVKTESTTGGFGLTNSGFRGIG
ncbi:MAG: alpha-L-arabinofuranosidase, partial [Acidobacteriota bacterium]